MQYYIVWGLIATVVALAARRFVKMRGSSPKVPFAARAALMLASATIAIVSITIMRDEAAGAADPSVAYMSTPSHIFPLMIGSAAGCVGGFLPPSRLASIATARAFRPASALFICAGLALILYLSFDLSFRDPRVYRYGILVVSLAAAVILILVRAWQDLSSRREWLVTDYIGLRSYSIYLFHWPFMILSAQIADGIGVPAGTAPLWGAALGIPATFFVAELSYRWVEQPFRARRRSGYAGGASVAHMRGRGTQRDADGMGWSLLGHTRYSGPLKAAVACAAVALAILSLGAALTSPRISSIELGLRHGAMSLDVSALRGLYDEAAADAGDPILNNGAAPEGDGK
jgi:peptidoglycan/LPS O-acetylase OafA/YrhL